MSIRSLVGILDEQSARHPDGLAVVLDDRELDWAALAERTRRLSNGLAALGVERGDRVAFLDRNSIEYFEFVFACGALGVAANVLNWRLTPAEVSFIVADAAPAVVVVRADLEEVIRSAVADADVAPTVLVIGAGAGRDDDYETWLAAQPDDPRVDDPRDDDVVIQMYTSGTTGTPKGARITNANVAALLRAAGEWRMDETSVNLAAMPLFHIGGGGWALSGMAYGAATVLVRDLDPRGLLVTMARHDVTHAFLVPTVIRMLLDQPEELAVPTLAFLAYGASPIPEPVLRRALDRFGPVLCQLYGMTETTGAVVQLDPEDHATSGPLAPLLRSAGRAMPGVELRVVDPETLADVPEGEVGEVWIRTPSVMQGYWQLPEATARALPGDGWFRSGDLGSLEDGYLFIRGRVSDMIISGGENVYPAEVVSVLMDHPALADAAVVGVPSEEWGETPRAVVVVRDGQHVTADELRAHCRQSLAGYKCPTEFHTMGELPRNESGKVRKDLLAGDLQDLHATGLA